MNRYLYASHSLLAIVLVIIGIYHSASFERRSALASPLVTRKPPFNGSIFGKRSNWPVFPSENQELYGYNNPAISYSRDFQAQPTAELSSASLMMRQLQQIQAEDLIKAAMSLCLAQQRATRAETDSLAVELCADLFLTKRAGAKRGSSNNDAVWSGRIMAEK